jgi:hypothetical protein
MREFLTSRRVLALIAVLVVAFVAFEVGVRLLQPDAVSYQIERFPNPYSTGSGGQYSAVSGTITDPATVARWRAAMTAKPAEPLASSYFRWFELSIYCVGPTFATYTFTWHGLPVEVSRTRQRPVGSHFRYREAGYPTGTPTPLTRCHSPEPQP